mgnify:CR=1 FL=1
MFKKTICLLALIILSQSSLLAIDVMQEGSDDELVLFTVPSYCELDWSSPKALLISATKSYATPQFRSYSKRAIGHVFILLRSSSAEYDVLTGMVTGQEDELKTLALEKGYGLGVLGADVKGKLEEKEKLEVETNDRLARGTLAYIRFKLSQETSKRLFDYYEMYRDRGHCNHYGGANRPRYSEGGGCSAFGVSFLEVAGLMTMDYESNWQVEVNIPEKHYGGPLTGKNVPFSDVVVDNWKDSKWAVDDEAHINLKMWDPSLIYKWILAQHARELKDGTPYYLAVTFGKAKGLVVDCRQMPTPTEPVFLDVCKAPNPYGRQPGLYPGDNNSNVARNHSIGINHMDISLAP